MSTPSGHNSDAVDVTSGLESTLHHSVCLRRCMNLVASPLLHLLTELILKVFVYAIDLCGGSSLFVLTAICHRLREVGVTFPRMWSTVKFTTPPMVELFFERCKYDPRILLATVSASTSYHPVDDPRWETIWEKSEGHTFNNLRSLVFEGTPQAFADRVVGVLRRASNISNLDLHCRTLPCRELPWPRSLDSVSCLSTLRLRNFPISWTSPLLRNLRHLALDFGISHISYEHTSLETFLAALTNCPNLETLKLAHAGPNQPNGHQDNCNTMVQLRRLRGLSIVFSDPSRIRYILSHIEYPASTIVELRASTEGYTEPSEAISQLLPRSNVETPQHSKREKGPHRLLGQQIHVLHRQPFHFP